MENNAVASNAIANNTKDSAPDTGSAQPSTEGERSPDADRQRFEVELEFVQCLANSAYLNCTCTSLAHCIIFTNRDAERD